MQQKRAVWADDDDSIAIGTARARAISVTAHAHDRAPTMVTAADATGVCGRTNPLWLPCPWPPVCAARAASPPHRPPSIRPLATIGGVTPPSQRAEGSWSAQLAHYPGRELARAADGGQARRGGVGGSSQSDGAGGAGGAGVLACCRVFVVAVCFFVVAVEYRRRAGGSVGGDCVAETLQGEAFECAAAAAGRSGQPPREEQRADGSCMPPPAAPPPAARRRAASGNEIRVRAWVG